MKSNYKHMTFELNWHFSFALWGSAAGNQSRRFQVRHEMYFNVEWLATGIIYDSFGKMSTTYKLYIQPEHPKCELIPKRPMARWYFQPGYPMDIDDLIVSWCDYGHKILWLSLSVCVKIYVWKNMKNQSLIFCVHPKIRAVVVLELSVIHQLLAVYWTTPWKFFRLFSCQWLRNHSDVSGRNSYFQHSKC